MILEEIAPGGTPLPRLFPGHIKGVMGAISDRGRGHNRVFSGRSRSALRFLSDRHSGVSSRDPGAPGSMLRCTDRIADWEPAPMPADLEEAFLKQDST
jgi:hypothetical protein